MHALGGDALRDARGAKAAAEPRRAPLRAYAVTGTSRGAVAAALAFAGLLPTCYSSSPPPPAKLDELHDYCDAHLAKAPVDLSRVKGVGVLPERRPPGTPVVVYGASWCTACTWAEAYLRRRGIPFVTKDTEDDPAAKAEMLAILARTGLAGDHAIPVVDVRGTISTGFMPCVIEYAWYAP